MHAGAVVEHSATAFVLGLFCFADTWQAGVRPHAPGPFLLRR